MSMDERFLVVGLIAAMVVAFCRVGGLLIGTYIGTDPRLRRILDILPTCAIGAVIGPSLVSVSVMQAVSLLVAGSIFMTCGRFLLALIGGVAVLMSSNWLEPYWGALFQFYAS